MFLPKFKAQKLYICVLKFAFLKTIYNTSNFISDSEKKDEETPKETKEVKIESHPEETKDEDKEETKEDDLGVFSPSINNEGGDSEEDELAKFIVKKPLPKR